MAQKLLYEETAYDVLDLATNEFINEPEHLIESKLQQRFQDYHYRNPHVFKLFRRFAEYAMKEGRKHFGAKAIMERVRWEVNIETSDPEEFKINNNYTSRYVRLLEAVDAKFKGFFSKRELRA